MKKTEQGFAVAVGLLVTVVIAIVSVVGFAVLHRSNKSSSASRVPATSTQDQAIKQAALAAQPAETIGTTAGVDSLTAQDQSSETSIDTKHTSSDQATAESVDNAALNVGGDYNESDF